MLETCGHLLLPEIGLCLCPSTTDALIFQTKLEKTSTKFQIFAFWRYKLLENRLITATATMSEKKHDFSNFWPIFVIFPGICFTGNIKKFKDGLITHVLQFWSVFVFFWTNLGPKLVQNWFNTVSMSEQIVYSENSSCKCLFYAFFVTMWPRTCLPYATHDCPSSAGLLGCVYLRASAHF